RRTKPLSRGSMTKPSSFTAASYETRGVDSHRRRFAANRDVSASLLPFLFLISHSFALSFVTMNMAGAETFDPTIVEMIPVGSDCEVDENDFARMYEDNLSLLVAIAMRKFQVPEPDAEGLAHEVFFSYLKRKNEIRDLHPWLIG